MLEFEATDFNELEEEFNRRAHEISIEILKGICKGIEENVDVVSLGILTQLNMDISVKRSDFIEALEVNIKRAEEMEEYELCSKVSDYIKMLKLERESKG